MSWKNGSGPCDTSKAILKDGRHYCSCLSLWQFKFPGLSLKSCRGPGYVFPSHTIFFFLLCTLLLTPPVLSVPAQRPDAGGSGRSGLLPLSFAPRPANRVNYRQHICILLPDNVSTAVQNPPLESSLGSAPCPEAGRPPCPLSRLSLSCNLFLASVGRYFSFSLFLSL